jgi:RNA polymerase sigma-70 factor (ECF subfamily)
MRTKRSKAAEFAESVFKDYGRQLHRFLVRRLQHAQDAEDLAQQVYMELISVEHSELVRNPRGYALRIAANVASDFQRNASALRSRVSFDSETADRASEHPTLIEPEEMASRVLSAQRLRLAFERLAPLHRAAFLLQARDGYSYEETATKLKVSVRRVERLLAEAKELLQGLLQQDER